MFVVYVILTSTLGGVCYWMLSLPVDGSSKVKPSGETIYEPKISLKQVEGKTQDPEIILLSEMVGGGSPETSTEIDYEFLKPETKRETPQEKNNSITKQATESMKKCTIILTTVFIVSTFQGIWISYAYVFLKELNGPTMLIGVSMTVSPMISAFTYAFLSHILKWVGGKCPHSFS